MNRQFSITNISKLLKQNPSLTNPVILSKKQQIVLTMKIPWTFILMLFALNLSSSPPTYSTFENLTETRWITFHKTMIQEQLPDMECLFEPRYTSEVESYLRAYLTYGIRDTEYLLGRAVMYFPVFEHYTQLYDLPDGLKYLPLIESRLRPVATSTVGAAGLWQFMPPTARSKGLRIDGYVDERRDTYKSTQVALKYLSDLYKRFGQWELALAAYNCGAGRVNKAIRYAGSKDFWKILRYLPRETRNYVPRFIAATYVANFYHMHGLQLRYPDFEMQWTRTTKVYDYTTFKQITNKTGANTRILYRLNPGYRKGIIPRSESGNFLILPEQSMALFKDWKRDKTDHQTIELNTKKVKSTYVVLAGDTIEKLARLFKCTEAEIIEWNNLKSKELYYRQELILYRDKGNDTPSRA